MIKETLSKLNVWIIINNYSDDFFESLNNVFHNYTLKYDYNY